VTAPAEPTSLIVVDAAPGTPARVMNAGTALSREVAQEQAAVVERAFRRERLRRRTALFTMPGATLLYGLFAWATAPSKVEVEAVIAAFAAVLAGPLTLHLLWGVRNRALLDVAAADGAASRAVLVDAVRRMRRHGLGPSTALREAQAAVPGR
jgi:hypothetical protein